ncbi:hypothetical protein CEXT_461631 [Caerostris extrusa]|uniref:Uncharacterized protein n=1 Tax=Caerostris extrusa TaxID=172846 RepID=A0AAV4X790_CAEEX|nr:hypothetical protein CEXT_461631 [Caerostris extrusa]
MSSLNFCLDVGEIDVSCDVRKVRVLTGFVISGAFEILVSSEQVLDLLWSLLLFESDGRVNKFRKMEDDFGDCQ